VTVRTILIADASGSMSHLANDVRGGHNAYLDKVAASVDPTTDEDVRITLATFNTTVTVVDNDVPIAKATRLDAHNYVPDGGTALLDAIGQTLRQFVANATFEPGDKVFVYIQTDGEENSSKEYTKEAVAAVIAEMEAKEWAFVFSGTGPDGWADRGSVGLAHASTMNAADSKGILRSYTGRGDTVISYLGSDQATRSTFTSANVSSLIQDTIDQPEEGGDAPT
jgi:hypothetical protein